jgi:fatty acid desaturase
MSRNYSRVAEGTRKRRRRNSVLISVAVAAAIVLLLAFEQIALLYLLATVGVAVLLLIVAFADLHGATPMAAAVQPAVPDDSAAIADGLAQAAGVAPTSPQGTARQRAAKRRQRR